jgi:hypothetical protein
MNVRIKPSSQGTFRSIAIAAKHGTQANFVHIVAGLCFLHCRVEKEGKNVFFRDHLEKLGAIDLADPYFPYDTNLDLQRGAVKNRRGRTMTKVHISPPPKLQADRPQRP